MAKAKGLVARLNKEIESQKASIEAIWRLLGTGENQTIFAAQFFDELIIEFSLYLVVEIPNQASAKERIGSRYRSEQEYSSCYHYSIICKIFGVSKKSWAYTRIHAFDRDQQRDSSQTITLVSINITYALWDF